VEDINQAKESWEAAMSETCPKCGIKMPTGMCQWHLIDGDDCLRNQLTAAQARIADLEFANSELLKDAEAGQELMDTRDDEQQKELRRLHTRISELEKMLEISSKMCDEWRASFLRHHNSGPAAEGA
jgi:hypothetical protein